MENKHRKLCKTCQYRSSTPKLNSCDYIELMEHSRSCPVEDCDKYIKGPRLRKNTTVTLKGNIPNKSLRGSAPKPIKEVSEQRAKKYKGCMEKPKEESNKLVKKKRGRPRVLTDEQRKANRHDYWVRYYQKNKSELKQKNKIYYETHKKGRNKNGSSENDDAVRC